MQFDFTKRFTDEKLKEFAELIQEMATGIGFKVSARGWCYLMEQAGHINKSQFDKVDSAINRCRKEGLLPVDFVAEEDARAFSGIEIPSSEEGKEMEDILAWMLRDVLDGAKYYTPDWWEGEEFYIQLLVEKIDLKTMFEPICREYHIPIANAKGWSSILQRAEYARRFKEAEEKGLQPVLLYCGDHDPDGLRISDTIRKNLEQIADIRWDDGTEGYDPVNLKIERFGLNYEFIIKNRFTWIDNLITGSGLNLNDASHKNYKLPYVQQYLKKVGARKCEANVIVTKPTQAASLIRTEIERWVGKEAKDRFRKKRIAANIEYDNLLEESGLREPIEKFQKKDD